MVDCSLAVVTQPTYRGAKPFPSMRYELVNSAEDSRARDEATAPQPPVAMAWALAAAKAAA